MPQVYDYPVSFSLRLQTNPNKQSLIEYIKDAVESWGGQLEPPNEDNNFTGDPLFGEKKVKHVHVRKYDTKQRLVAQAARRVKKIEKELGL